jgi:hypothetical protein
MPLSEAYIQWNRAIAEYYFSETSDNNDVYLTITPRILGVAISKYRGKTISPHEAESDFIKTVSDVYRTEVKRIGLKVAFKTSHGQDRLPKCLGFLALSVLAAYQMHSDEDTGGNAYYKRLADLLGCKLEGNYPEGFTTSEFEELWKYLQKNQSRIAFVEPESNSKRYVAYPLAHVPLRQIDVEKLPEFFATAGYEPESRVSHDTINTDLNRLDYAFSKPGRAALNDSRRKVAITEIAQELECWDGSVKEAIDRRSTRVEMLLEFRNRRPQLYYLPRQPVEFPEVFDDGVNRFESSEEGWYSLSPVTREHGEALVNGFAWESTVDRTQFVLKRSGTKAIGFVPSNNHSYSGYLSRPRLIRGAPCSVLVHESLHEQTNDYLNTITSSRCEARSHRELPEGWCLFSDLIIERYPEFVPPELSTLDIESNVDIITVGGLKLGRRNAWLLGAHPRLIVTGLEKGQQPMIDGQAVAITGDGLLVDEDNALSRPGIHTIEIGSFSKQIEIVEPEVNNVSIGWVFDRPNTSHQIALPQGAWQLIGATPGELFEARSDVWNGFIADCPFQPIWAVSITKQLQMLEDNLSPIELDEIVPGFKTLRIKEFSPRKCNLDYPALKVIAGRLGCDINDLAQLDNKDFLHFIGKDIPVKVLSLVPKPPAFQRTKSISRAQKSVEKWVSFIHNAGVCEVEVTSIYSGLSLDELEMNWRNYTCGASIVKKIIWGKKR